MDKGYKKLVWDTEVFGYSVVLITETKITSNTLRKILNDLAKDETKLAYLFLNPDDSLANEVAKENNGQLVDKKVTYIQSLTDVQDSDVSSGIISYKNKHITNELLLLALQSGEYSRFKIDRHFIHGEYKKLYKEWIEKSLHGTIAKDVLVYQENKKILGIITIGEKNERCDIGLFAVDEKSRGKSIGRKLMQATLMKAKELDYSLIQVVTQKDNTIACSFYEKMGFKQESIQNVYHFWL